MMRSMPVPRWQACFPVRLAERIAVAEQAVPPRTITRQRRPSDKQRFRIFDQDDVSRNGLNKRVTGRMFLTSNRMPDAEPGRQPAQHLSQTVLLPCHIRPLLR